MATYQTGDWNTQEKINWLLKARLNVYRGAWSITERNEVKEGLRRVKSLKLTERDRIFLVGQGVLKIQALANRFWVGRAKACSTSKTGRTFRCLVTLFKTHLPCDTFQTPRQSELLSPRSFYTPKCSPACDRALGTLRYEYLTPGLHIRQMVTASRAEAKANLLLYPHWRYSTYACWVDERISGSDLR